MQAIENLVEQKKELDYVLLECAGTADPGHLLFSTSAIVLTLGVGKVASMFWLDDALESDIYLDGIVTVVDAMHYVQV